MAESKTYTGDLSTAIVSKIASAIEQRKQEKEIDKTKATPEVKQAAKKLISDEGSSTQVTKDTDLKTYIAKVFGSELDAGIIQTEGSIGKLSDQVLFASEGLVNAQKLLINQNELMESKFDTMLDLFRTRNEIEKNREDRLKADDEEFSIEGVDEDFGSADAATTARGDILDLFKKGSKVARAISLLVRGLGVRTVAAGVVKGTGMGITKKFSKNIAQKIATDRLLSEGGKRTARKITKRAAVNTAKTTIQRQVGKRVSGDLIPKIFSSKPIKDALLKKLGSEGAEKIAVKIASKSVPVAQTAYGIVEGLARFLMGDPKGFALSMGSAVPIAGYGFTILDIFRDINIGAYEKHIESNFLKGITDENITDFIREALGVSPDQYETGGITPKQYETGTRLQPLLSNKIFEKSIVSSSLLLASAAGITPQVNAEIRSAGLGNIPIDNLNDRTDIGRISQSFFSSGLNKNNMLYRPIPPLPSIDSMDTQEQGKQPWKVLGIELPDLGVTEITSSAIKSIRDIVWGRKDDGFWGPPWLGIKRGNKEEPKPKQVQPKTTISGSTITDIEELAFLKMVRHVEGTRSDDSYNRWFGGRTDMNMTEMTLQELYDEQTRRMDAGETTYNGLSSAAVGLGQFMDPLNQAKGMYASQGKEFDPTKIKFSKDLQLQLILHLAKKKRGIDVSEPLTIEGLSELQKEWAGIGPFHGQTKRTLEESLQIYNDYLKQMEMAPIEDRKVSQLNSTSFDVEDSLDPYGNNQPIVITNTTYVSSDDTTMVTSINRGNDDWIKKYKLYSLIS